jgi:polysaccharide biosynthesis protein PslH
VVPLRLGGGMRVKVLEAMAMGKCIVASPLAVQGLNVRPGEHLLVAESDEEFAAAVRRVLGDPPYRHLLARNARAWAEEHLGWGTSVGAYEAIYRDLRGEPTPVVAPAEGVPAWL